MLFLTLLLSCHRQEPAEVASAEATIAEARAWFDRTHGTAPSGRRKPALRDMEHKPRWDKAVRTADGAVSLPVETWFSGKTLLNRTNNTQLRMRRTASGWEERYKETVADAAYVTRTKGVVREEDFTGMVSELDGDGNFLGGQLWRDGKPEADLYPTGEASQSGRTKNCTTFTTVTVAYGGADYGGRTVMVEIGRYYSNYIVCWQVPKVMDGGGNYYAPSGYGVGSTGGGLVISEFVMPNAAAAGIAAGPKPIPHISKCAGIQTMWNNSVTSKKERIGFVTQNGGLLETPQGSYDNINVEGVYEQGGVIYYQYEQSVGAKLPTWPGTVSNTANVQEGNVRVYVPIIATVHTHVPCLDDGTNGASHPVGADDHALATRFPKIRHYVVGCNGTVAEFSGSSSLFFNVVEGKKLSESCESVK